MTDTATPVTNAARPTSIATPVSVATTVSDDSDRQHIATPDYAKQLTTRPTSKVTPPTPSPSPSPTPSSFDDDPSCRSVQRSLDFNEPRSGEPRLPGRTDSLYGTRTTGDEHDEMNYFIENKSSEIVEFRLKIGDRITFSRLLTPDLCFHGSFRAETCELTLRIAGQLGSNGKRIYWRPEEWTPPPFARGQENHFTITDECMGHLVVADDDYDDVDDNDNNNNDNTK